MANSFTDVRTDFFTLQEEAQKKSRLLVACIILMLPLAVMDTYLVLYSQPCLFKSDSRMSRPESTMALLACL